MATAPASRQAPSPKEQEIITLKHAWFTKCTQGHFILVAHGGHLTRVIHEVKGWHTNEDGDFELGKDTKIKGPVEIIDSLARRFTGTRLVGPPFLNYGMHQHKFEWSDYRIRKDGDTIVHGAAMHDSEIIYMVPFEASFEFPFADIDVLKDDKKDTDLEPFVPMGLSISFRTRMISPRIALMDNRGEWYRKTLLPRLEKELQDFARGYTYRAILTTGTTSISEEFFAHIMGTKTTPSVFREKLLRDAGVDLVEVGISKVIANPDYEKALLEQARKETEAESNLVLARSAAEATKVQAEADLFATEKRAAGIRTIGDAEAAAIKAKRQAAGVYYPDEIKWGALKGLTGLKVLGSLGDDKTSPVLVSVGDE